MTITEREGFDIGSELTTIGKIVVGVTDTITYKYGNPDIIEPYVFAEYDFSYLVDKYSEDQFILNSIDKYTQDKLDWKSLYMFPTVVTDGENIRERYFGMFGNLYFLKVDEGESVVRLYVNYETNIDNPDITITFDENEAKFNKMLYIYISSNKLTLIILFDEI